MKKLLIVLFIGIVSLLTTSCDGVALCYDSTPVYVSYRVPYYSHHYHYNHRPHIIHHRIRKY